MDNVNNVNETREDLAKKSAILRTIPKNCTEVAVTTSSATASLAAYSGQTIWLRAVTAEITVLLAASVVAGKGYGVSTSAYTEFYVDPYETVTTLAHRVASGTATLQILHD